MLDDALRIHRAFGRSITTRCCPAPEKAAPCRAAGDLRAWSNFETKSNFETARNGPKSPEIRAAGCGKPGENGLPSSFRTATPVFSRAVQQFGRSGYPR